MNVYQQAAQINVRHDFAAPGMESMRSQGEILAPIPFVCRMRADEIADQVEQVIQGSSDAESVNLQAVRRAVEEYAHFILYEMERYAEQAVDELLRNNMTWDDVEADEMPHLFLYIEA